MAGRIKIDVRIALEIHVQSGENSLLPRPENKRASTIGLFLEGSAPPNLARGVKIFGKSSAIPSTRLPIRSLLGTKTDPHGVFAKRGLAL